MSQNLIIVVLLFITFSSFSQKSTDGKVFLDSTWNETTEADHKYFRIIKDYYSDKDNYSISDYYKSGKLQMNGTSKYKDRLIKEGQFVYYYENGKKKSLENYVNDRQIGKQYNWYQNGQVKSETEYFIDENENYPIYKIIQFWDPDGNQKIIDGNGEYEIKNSDYFEIGKLENGLKHGIWQGAIKSSNLTFQETYDTGKLIKGTSTDSQNIKYEYTEKSSMSGPKKGTKHFYQFFGSNFKISDEARNKNIKGRLLLFFIIEGDGSVSEIKVINGLGYGLDQEAIRLVKLYKEWTPGKSRGVGYKVPYTLPISIQ
jgi:antitoxin component YwqK of YwqJK toxin-antitoxin module